MSPTDDTATVLLLRRAADEQQPPPGGPDLDQVVRGGARRRHRAARTRAVVASASATAVLVAVVALGADLLGGPPGPGPAGDGQGARDGLVLLDEPAGPEDRLTDRLRETAPQVVPGSTRLLARDDGVAYYAGRDGEGAVCLLAEGGAQAGSWCAAAGDFAAEGGITGIMSDGDRVTVLAVLVPDVRGPQPSTAAVDDALVQELEAGHRLTPNLLARVDRPPAEGSAEAALRPADVLALLARPATAADELPTTWADGSEVGADYDDGSPRRLAEVGDVSFFAATKDGEVCVVLQLPDVVGSGCQPAWSFARQGAVSEVAGPGGGASAVLLPDGLADVALADLPPSLQEAGGQPFTTEDRVLPNLLVRVPARAGAP